MQEPQFYATLEQEAAIRFESRFLKGSLPSRHGGSSISGERTNVDQSKSG
jgi:hypothetical protein